MPDFATISPDELVRRIVDRLGPDPHGPGYSHFDVAPPPTGPAAYVLIVGAGFSYGVVPLVSDLLRRTIGDYYYPDQDMTSLERPAGVLEGHSASFWAEYNDAAAGGGLPAVELDGSGLPTDPGAAYQSLFVSDVADVLFGRAPGGPRPGGPPGVGRRFVDGFLRYVLDPGAEHGRGSTGRSQLNPAHVHLAALLEAQQLGRGWAGRAFCRTVVTTNFDTLLQNALQMVNLLYRLTDRPDQGLDDSDFAGEEGPIHLVYTHGSILRHNPASTIEELGGLATRNARVLRGLLESRDVLVVGYGGWNDGLMAALGACGAGRHTVYWCGVDPQPPEHVAGLLRRRAPDAAYVALGRPAADGLMRALHDALVPAGERRDPMQRYRDWTGLVWNRPTGPSR